MYKNLALELQLPDRFLKKENMVRILFFACMLTAVLAQAQLPEAARRLAESEAFRHGHFSLCVMDVKAKRTVAVLNEEMSLTPASTLKAMTTATALSVLGEEYRFTTFLEHDGELLADGTLRGNLYIRGMGDPTLGSPFMEGAASFEELLNIWQQAVLDAGIRRVEGAVIGDATWLEDDVLARDWEWQDIGNYYACGAWGLNIHENLYYLYFQQNPRIGGGASVHSIVPEVPGLKVVNEVVSGSPSSGDNAYIFGAPYTFLRQVRGSIPAGRSLFSIKGSIPEPPLLVAQHLHSALQGCGIEVAEKPTTLRRLGGRAASKERSPLYVHYSPPLREIIRRANHKSVNLYCELLLRVIGKEKSGQGSAAAGIAAIKAFWSGRGLPMEGLYLKDGSGLSRSNGISARQLALMLAKTGRDPALFPAFLSSLPVAGQSGTLKSMLRGTAATGQVAAKSGTMERVRAYAGYITTRSGRLLAFAMIANQFAGSSSAVRQQMERILLDLYRR